QLVETIGRSCQQSASEPEFRLYPFSFKVVDSPEVNAFSLPGGPVYVNLGLIELVETEDELAAVIAHEMAHVVSRHATERMTTLQLSQMALLVGLTAVGGAPALALEGGQLAYILGILRYSRGMESEADAVAIDLLPEAGYDPRGMEGMLRKLDEERRAEPVLLERLLSSHPLPDSRLGEVSRLLTGAATPESPPRRSSGFARMKVLFARD
ncbi:MAG: M48 family metalloprotease, partial [Candidatus Binatia bacterium]